jgi:hypothetical protein
MTQLTRFTWENALLGHGGPESATDRLVGMVIAHHVKKPGSLKCWPSTTTLAFKSGLSQKSVIECIKNLVMAGWLEKRSGQMQGMQRRGSIYTLRLPAIIPQLQGRTDGDGVIHLDWQTAEPASAHANSSTVSSPSLTAECSSVDNATSVTPRPLNLSEPTAEPDGSRPLNVTDSLLINKKKEEEKDFEVRSGKSISFLSALKREGQNRHERGAYGSDGLLAWASSQGIYRETGETEGDFMRRASGAYGDWHKALKGGVQGGGG